MNTKVLMITGSYPPMRCGVGGYAEILTKLMRRRNGLVMGVLTSADAASNPPVAVQAFRYRLAPAHPGDCDMA